MELGELVKENPEITFKILEELGINENRLAALIEIYSKLDEYSKSISMERSHGDWIAKVQLNKKIDSSTSLEAYLKKAGIKVEKDKIFPHSDIYILLVEDAPTASSRFFHVHFYNPKQ